MSDPPKQKKKPNKKIAPPIGTIYILDEGNNSYWLAIDYNTYELIGTVRNTRLLQLIIRHDLDKYLSTGLIKYIKNDIPRKK